MSLGDAWLEVAAVLPDGWGVGIQPVSTGYEVGASPDTTWVLETFNAELPAALHDLAELLWRALGR